MCVVADVKSCLLSGSNVIFLIDGSDGTRPHELNILKSWMKKIIDTFKIEEVNR